MKKDKIHIEVKGEDVGRPANRPPKSNWRIEMVKKGLSVLQHASPVKSAEIVWHYFTMPGFTKFTDNQIKLLQIADTYHYTYRGDKITGFRWGTGVKKVLVCHGWRSKTADFRSMIERFLKDGYTVEGLDMRAHGKSEGTHTALPEYMDILKNHYAGHGPYDIVVGYSLGGLAAGIVLSELSKTLHPKHLFIIASPPYITYFFKDIIHSVGLNDKVYEAFKRLVQKIYYRPAEYYDLRDKKEFLDQIDTYMMYCEDDTVVPYKRGQELECAWPHANFVHIKGLGHYKIINNDQVLEYILGRANRSMDAL